jgi:diguanylate cyclase (GGDEF)-like protein
MIDMDNLKPINDQLGHAAGNRAIVALAEAVTEQLRETDFAARYGGDEFVLILPHTSSAEARALAERLRRAIRRVEMEGTRMPLRASLGVAALAAGTEASADALIRAADAALYRAKRTGRDRVCVAGEEGVHVETSEGV